MLTINQLPILYRFGIDSCIDIVWIKLTRFSLSLVIFALTLIVQFANENYT